MFIQSYTKSKQKLKFYLLLSFISVFIAKCTLFKNKSKFNIFVLCYSSYDDLIALR